MEAGISACAKHFIFIGENSTVEIFEVFTEVAVSVYNIRRSARILLNSEQNHQIDVNLLNLLLHLLIRKID
jgi:hypothetical protein